MKYFLLGIILPLAFTSSAYTPYGQPPRAIRVSFEYMEACELGPVCKPIAASRKRGEQLELVLPELFRTSVTIWDEENFGKLMKHQGTYKPLHRTGSSEVGERHEIVIPLSKLKDGTYHVWVVGDSVGGFFEVHIKTE